MSSLHWALGGSDLIVSKLIKMIIKMSFLKYKSNYISCFSHHLKAKSNLLAQHENLSAYFMHLTTSVLTLLIFLLH